MKSFKKLINQFKEINNSISGIEFNDIYFLPSDKSIFSINPIFKNKKIIKPQIYLQLDPEFSKSQYISIPKDIKYIWQPISDYIKDFNIIKTENNISNISDDVIQGNIGNSYFISALKFLSEEKERINSLFDINNTNNTNKKYFEVFIYINGYKSKIIIDNKFPFISNKENNKIDIYFL